MEKTRDLLFEEAQPWDCEVEHQIGLKTVSLSWKQVNYLKLYVLNADNTSFFPKLGPNNAGSQAHTHKRGA